MKNMVEKQLIQKLKTNLNLPIYKKQFKNKKFYYLFGKLTRIFDSYLNVDEILKLELTFFYNFKIETLKENLEFILNSQVAFISNSVILDNLSLFIWNKINNNNSNVEDEWKNILIFNIFIESLKDVYPDFNDFVIKILRLVN